MEGRWIIPGNDDSSKEKHNPLYKRDVYYVRPKDRDLCVTVFSDERIVKREVFHSEFIGTVRLEKNRGEKEEYDHVIIEIGEKEVKVKAIKPAKLKNADSEVCDEAPISDGTLITMECFGIEYLLYAEYIEPSKRIYKNYQLVQADRMNIGKGSACELRYTSNHVADIQACIFWSKGCWEIKSEKSKIGVYVNDKRAYNTILSEGDRITILGLNMVLGIGYFSVCAREGDTVTNPKFLKHVTKAEELMMFEFPVDVKREKPLFNRNPRQRLPLEKKTITVEAPPMPLNSHKIPLMLRMGGSMVMSGSAMMSGHYTSMLSSVLFPILSQRYTDKEKAEYEERRQTLYRKYLKEKKEEIETEKKHEEEVLTANYPDISEVLSYPDSGEKLWERRKTDDDYMCIRLGYGDQPFRAEIDYPEERFDLDDDILESEMYKLVKKQVLLKDVPIMIDFKKNNVCSILGDKTFAYEIAKNLILRTIVLNSYDEFKLVYLSEAEDMREFEFVKYIPHIWDDMKNRRYIANNLKEAGAIGELLNNEIIEPLNSGVNEKKKILNRPYYFVIALSKRIFDSVDVLKEIMQLGPESKVGILTVFGNAIKDSTLLIEPKDEEKCVIKYIEEIERDEEEFVLDRYEERLEKDCITAVTNTELRMVAESYSLPKMITILELFGVGRVEQLNPGRRWKENNPVKSLSTPIGLATNGDLFTMDIHEKYQGPHGLVAGTTGSGKSEFLITYILSMAINYHPDEVAFVLIDFKGGGLADAFDNPKKGIHLPHLVGTITNLDGASMKRTLKSIQSELTRRQETFKSVKKEFDDGTLDIYAYQKLYRNGLVEEPMPHLIIISDEFAELKDQQPEFMDDLISAARIGRSLGVHLILATQKPNGVVNAQIRSNTKFRVCLKVQDRGDSEDMLKRPEAADIKESGRFYMQVGYNEFFALGQSAWSGAPYIPCDEVSVQPDETIEFIDASGQTVHLASEKPEVDSGDGSQLVAIVKLLSQYAKDSGIKQRRLWLPPLENEIDIDELNSDLLYDKDDSRDIELKYAVADDPSKQTQYNLTLNFSTMRSLMVLGSVETGKTSFVQSVLSLMIRKYTPEELQFYIIDYSSRTLRMFEKLPHCGSVITEENENQLDSFFELINGIVRERKRLFSNLEIDSYETARKKLRLPLILVIIDGLGSLISTKKGESLNYKLSAYVKDTARYGVKYIITCNSSSQLMPGVRQEISDSVVFRIKDIFDYSNLIGCKVSDFCEDKPGRGLCNGGGYPVEFQTAVYKPGLSVAERLESIKQLISQVVGDNSSAVKARHLAVLDKNADYESFVLQFDSERIPLGFNLANSKPVALPLRQMSKLILYFGKNEHQEMLIENFVLSVIREKMKLFIIKRAQNSVFSESFKYSADLLEMTRYIPLEEGAITAFWNELGGILKDRKAVYEEYCAQNNLEKTNVIEDKGYYGYLRKNTEPICIIIENMGDFCGAMDAVSAMVFETLFQKGNLRNIYVIAGYEPGDIEKAQGKLLYMSFSDNADIIYFGGNYEQQDFSGIQEFDVSDSHNIPFNFGLMRYMHQMNPILMPCGEIQTDDRDTDAGNIFL